MRVDDLNQLRIGEEVILLRKGDKENELVVVRSINDWTKSIGVERPNGKYKEYPPRRIMRFGYSERDE